MTTQINITCGQTLGLRLEALAKWHHVSREQVVLTVLEKSLDQVWASEGRKFDAFIKDLNHKNRHLLKTNQI